MNDFTRDMLEYTRETLREHRKPVTVENLSKHIFSEFIAYRDAMIEFEANRTFEAVPHARLIKLSDTVLRLMFEHGLECGVPASDDNAIESVCFGLACLRWINREDRGYVPKLEYSDAEIALWIRESETHQMSLFGEMESAA